MWISEELTKQKGEERCKPRNSRGHVQRHETNRVPQLGNCGMTVLATGEEVRIKDIYGPDNDK